MSALVEVALFCAKEPYMKAISILGTFNKLFLIFSTIPADFLTILFFSKTF